MDTLSAAKLEWRMRSQQQQQQQQQAEEGCRRELCSGDRRASVLAARTQREAVERHPTCM